MPNRFPTFVCMAAFLFLAGILLGFVIPPAAELGEITYVREAMGR